MNNLITFVVYGKNSLRLPYSLKMNEWTKKQSLYFSHKNELINIHRAVVEG
jgi:ribosomal protein L25 (general stress protein Ctc)